MTLRPILALVLQKGICGDEITEAEERTMSTVTGIENHLQAPTNAAVERVSPVRPITPFPQSSRSFAQELSAATARVDRIEKNTSPVAGQTRPAPLLLASASNVNAKRGLASPTPSRASALRMPTPRPGMSNAQSALSPEFKPLPTSSAARILSSPAPTKPTHSSATGPSRTPPASTTNLMQQMVNDYREYERMMSKQNVPQAQPSSAEPSGNMPTLERGEGSLEIAQPFAQAIFESQTAPLPEGETSAESSRVQPVDRSAFIPTPFPRGTQIAQTTPFPKPTAEPAPLEESACASYKDEQLLANAGGDNYVREGDTMRVDPSYDHSKFTARVGKDLKDAGQNLKDAAGDLSKGSVAHARTPSGEIESRHRPGLFGTLGNFAKDVVSGATLGFYRPSGDPEPSGFSRVFYPFKKILVDGVVKDLAVGIPASFLRAGEHTTLAAVNTAETLPDATIGNLEAGRKLTTAAFDNAQVGVSYLADVMPTGDAWARVGASGRGSDWGIPIITNLKAPEYDTTDPRFAGVRNTSLRKALETAGTLGIGAALAAASAPAAALGAGTAMRTGSELNARETAEQIAVPTTPTSAQPAAGLSIGQALRQTQGQYTPTPAAQTAYQQQTMSALYRPKLWQSPSEL